MVALSPSYCCQVPERHFGDPQYMFRVVQSVAKGARCSVQSDGMPQRIARSDVRPGGCVPSMT